MRFPRWVFTVAGLLVSLISVWQIRSAQDGLVITRLPGNSPPVTLITPQDSALSDRPVVLVAHGFAASHVIMRGFGLTLAHAGYNVVLWDFPGHGANPNPLLPESRMDELLQAAETALSKAQLEGLESSRGLAILGHSMGSGVALSFGLSHPETAATVAVSPIPIPVNPRLPRDLLLMAGSLETPFVSNARSLLAQAGGAGGDLNQGTARQLVIVPGVAHISILFSPTAHQTALDWMDGVFGPQPGARPYRDMRILWCVLGVVGVLIFFGSLAPLVREKPNTDEARSYPPIWRRLGALITGAMASTLLLWVFSQMGLSLQSLLGIQVGGYLLVWFAPAGIISLALMSRSPGRQTGRALLAGLVAFAALWLGVGFLGQFVFLQWLLIPARLVLWPLGSLLLLPWFLAVGQAVQQEAGWGRVSWWLLYTFLLTGAIFLALNLSPQLGFLIIVLPMFPIVLGLHALASAPYRNSWSFGLSGALFVSWLLLSLFPLL